ncbi:MAG: ATP-dependent DNA helicase, partial [Succinivibrionaceae bacterium]
INDSLKNFYTEGLFVNKYPNGYNGRPSTVSLKRNLHNSEISAKNYECDFFEKGCLDIEPICERVSKILLEFKNLFSLLNLLLGVNDELDFIIKGFMSRITDTASAFNNFLPELKKETFDDSNYYRSYSKSEDYFSFMSTPINPDQEFRSKILNNNIFSETSFLFTSATLATNKFYPPTVLDEHFRDGMFKCLESFMIKLGLHQKDTAVDIIDSPFNYQKNSLLCIPRECLMYGEENLSVKSIVKMILPVIKNTLGGVLLLTTATDSLKKFYKEFMEMNVKQVLNGRNVYCQNLEYSNSELIEKLKNEHCILIGTKSFWEGVDVPGKALTLLVIDKIPFPAQCIELTAERRHYNRIKTGKADDKFCAIDIQKAIIDLKQGVGRLIRTESDQGVVIICSPKLIPNNKYYKSYAKTIIEALPPFRLTYELSDVLNFLERID